MCIPALDPRDLPRPSQSFQQFLGCLDIPPRDGSINVRISGPLPCGCLPSRAAKKSGQRRFTVSVSAGTVTHTRCGQLIARFQEGQFVSEPMPESSPARTSDTDTGTGLTTRTRHSVEDIEGHDSGTTPGCSLD